MTGRELYERHLAAAADGTPLRAAMLRTVEGSASPIDLIDHASWEMWEAIFSLPPMSAPHGMTTGNGSTPTRTTDAEHASACAARAESSLRQLRRYLELDHRHETLQALARIEYKVGLITKGETIMAASIQDLIIAVANETTVTQSAVTLLGGLSSQLADVKAQLAAAGADTAGLQSVIDQVNANSTALAAAVAAGTVAAPGAVPVTPTPTTQP